ncbi:hypothetical protein MBLNU13_g00913t1 [Cladosporium sp. NU13]
MKSRKRNHSALEEEDRSPPGASSLPSGQTRQTRNTRHDPSASEVRRDSRRESDTLGRDRADNEHRPASRNFISTSARDTIPKTQRPQRTRSAQQTSQRATPLQPGVPYTLDSLKDKLKDNRAFNDLRRSLERELDRLGLIQPVGLHYNYDTNNATIFDIIIFPHIEFCRDENMIVDDEHNWLPAPGGYLLIKYRRAVVIDKYQGGLKLGTFTTFSNTPMEDKRKQRVFDEVKNETILSLSHYVHIVAVDNLDESHNYPECSLKGVPVRYRAAPKCRAGSVKDSFMNPHTPHIMTNGTPFLVVGHVECQESAARLKTAVEATFARTTSAMASALEAMSEQGRKKKDMMEASQGARPRNFHAKDRGQQDPAIKAFKYDGNSASPHMPPPPKKLKPDQTKPNIDLDAPSPPKLMIPDGYTLPDGMSSNSRIPNTALHGLNFLSNADGRSSMSYDGLGTPRGIFKF